MRIMPDDCQRASRFEHPEGFVDKGFMIAKMMDGIHNIDEIEGTVFIGDLNG